MLAICLSSNPPTNRGLRQYYVKMGRLSTERVELYQGVKDKSSGSVGTCSGGKKRKVFVDVTRLDSVRVE
jgi:hypothetical protein